MDYYIVSSTGTKTNLNELTREKISKMFAEELLKFRLSSKFECLDVNRCPGAKTCLIQRNEIKAKECPHYLYNKLLESGQQTLNNRFYGGNNIL